MDKKPPSMNDDFENLAESARALISATAGVAGEKVDDARTRLLAALENGREILGRVEEKGASAVRAADATVRKYPYQTLAIAAGIGAVIGYFAARQCSRASD
jgi:ElaB/YqjD/DUF883 family membrane-anchored ribosome-binding protein